MRLFVGIGFPDDAREALAGLQSGLRRARWVTSENLHLTLRFLGEVERPDAEELDAALSALSASAFDLELSGVGCFDRRGRPHMVWAGVAKSEPLTRLRDKVEQAAVRTGFSPEGRKFKAHATLGRLKDAPMADVGPWIEAHDDFRAGPFRIDRFTLFESTLGREGAHYEALTDYWLT